jgi:hypothetical protein
LDRTAVEPCDVPLHACTHAIGHHCRITLLQSMLMFPWPRGLL